VVQVDNTQLQAGFLVVHIGQLRHNLECGGLCFGGIVKVGSTLHAQKLALFVAGADFQVGVVQQLLVCGLVLADAQAQVVLVPHGKAQRAHARQIAIHRGKIKGRVVLQKLHNFFAWGHGCSSNHPRVIRFGCGAAG
jgi:hypothetical protein